MKRILCIAALVAATIVLMLPISTIARAESANSSFDKGYEKHRRGDLTTAIKLYSRAIEADSTFTMAYQMRGVAQQQLKKYPQAISDYTMMISVGESYFKSVGYYNRGVVKNMTGKFEEAIADFSMTIGIDKKMSAAFFHRGIAKSKIGDLTGRLDDFRQAALLGNSTAETWLNTYYPAWRQAPSIPPENNAAPL